MTTSPKISVVMPVYNAEAFLAEAIESVLAQTYADFEFLIYNDGSVDGSAGIIREYAAKDARIIFIDDPENRGYVPRLNAGIARAQGEYVARMDADDVSLPYRFALQVRELDAHPHLVLLGSSTTVIDLKGNRRKGWMFNATPDETRVNMLFTNYFAHPSVMMRKCAIPAEGYREHFMPSEDYDLWTRLSERGDIRSIQKPLLLYRDHPGNTSQVKRETTRARVIEILKLQLERLGMSPTDEDARFHNELSFDYVEYDDQGLDRARQWYQRIHFTNLITKKYVAHILLGTLIGRWYVLCSRQDSSWYMPGKIFWKSELLSLPGLTIGERFAFLANTGKKAIRYSFF